MENPSQPVTADKASVRLNRFFVLDTNVLLHDPNALYAFKGVVIAIPFVVLEELDKFKKEPGEKGRNAREAIRTLDTLRKNGCLSKGVPLNHNTDGAILKIIANPTEINFTKVSKDPYDLKDNFILQTVHNLVKEGLKVTLVSKDINVRVKADVLGLDAEDYTKGKIDYEQFYKGWTRISVPGVDLKIRDAKRVNTVVNTKEIFPNEFFILENQDNTTQYKLFRYLGENKFKEVSDLSLFNSFQAKNVQQLMALDLLMDDNVQLVTLLGPAGTGKTFLALLVGLYKVAHQKAFRKLLVTRPVVALGADIGYLPGDIQEKLHYWMQPVHDNLEFIYSKLLRGVEPHYNLSEQKESKERGRRKRYNDALYASPDTNIVLQLQRRGILSLEAITYMRGRSIPYQFVLIDEVQNLTPHEVKTIVSRAGEGTKVILAGDPYQIDSPYLDFTSNGLTVTTEKFKEFDIFGSVFLEISERSELAKLAAEVL
jgi:PhoH-like ATPase